MCEFFSFVTNGNGKPMYFGAEMRRKIIAGETEYQDTDSHTSIAHYNGCRGRDEDGLNKYEFNPLTGKFIVDQLNTVDDSLLAEKAVRGLDWAGVVPELIIKPIVNPLTDVKANPVSRREVDLLREWASAWDSQTSAWDSVRASVGDSVWDSVRYSVWYSLRAYILSFFTVDPGPFHTVIDLWESGFVPVRIRDEWALCAGPDAEIVY